MKVLILARYFMPPLASLKWHELRFGEPEPLQGQSLALMHEGSARTGITAIGGFFR